MDTNDIIKVTQSPQRLIEDQQYYQYIFKKTERIVSVVFYVSQSIKDTTRFQSHILDIETAARHVHDVVLRSLEIRSHVADDVVDEVIHALVSLESKLQVGHTVGLFPKDVLHVLGSEIDSVLRGISKYKHTTESAIVTDRSIVSSPTPATKQASTLKTTTTESSNHSGRREHIKAVLESVGEVTIKDISEVVTDVSTKTIQRELMSMIKDKIVEKVGEKRWSKYRLL